jgi:hypothetical protein
MSADTGHAFLTAEALAATKRLDQLDCFPMASDGDRARRTS